MITPKHVELQSTIFSFMTENLQGVSSQGVGRVSIPIAMLSMKNNIQKPQSQNNGFILIEMWEICLSRKLSNASM